MPARLIRVALLWLALVAAPARAQPPSDSLSDAELVRATIAAAREAARGVELRAVSPAHAANLEQHLTRLELATDQGRVPYKSLGRMNGNPFDQPRAPDRLGALRADFDSLKFYLEVPVDTAGHSVLDLYEARFGVDRRRELFDPLRVLRRRDHQMALDANQEALRRYEVKYGPGSARLNLLEAGVNHWLQRWSWFGPGASGPGPLEFLTAYSPIYGTVTDEHLAAVSAGEIGFRFYMFAPGWGVERGITSYLRPRFISFGAAMAGEEDGSLKVPWGPGDKRIGPFATWGGFKAAYLFGIGGARNTFMLTRQFHVVPNVF